VRNRGKRDCGTLRAVRRHAAPLCSDLLLQRGQSALQRGTVFRRGLYCLIWHPSLIVSHEVCWTRTQYIGTAEPLCEPRQDVLAAGLWPAPSSIRHCWRQPSLVQLDFGVVYLIHTWSNSMCVLRIQHVKWRWRTQPGPDNAAFTDSQNFITKEGWLHHTSAVSLPPALRGDLLVAVPTLAA